MRVKRWLVITLGAPGGARQHWSREGLAEQEKRIRREGVPSVQGCLYLSGRSRGPLWTASPHFFLTGIICDSCENFENSHRRRVLMRSFPWSSGPALGETGQNIKGRSRHFFFLPPPTPVPPLPKNGGKKKDEEEGFKAHDTERGILHLFGRESSLQT